MVKHCRVNVVPRDAVDCNQLQSLVGKYVPEYTSYKVFKVQDMIVVLLNVGGITYLHQDDKVAECDPTVSVNELARQLKLWQLD